MQPVLYLPHLAHISSDKKPVLCRKRVDILHCIIYSCRYFCIKKHRIENADINVWSITTLKAKLFFKSLEEESMMTMETTPAPHRSARDEAPSSTTCRSAPSRHRSSASATENRSTGR